MSATEVRLKARAICFSTLPLPQISLETFFYWKYVRRFVVLHGFSFTSTVPQPTDIIRTEYTKCRLYSASRG
jgi:hypothetical protein